MDILRSFAKRLDDWFLVHQPTLWMFRPVRWLALVALLLALTLLAGLLQRLEHGALASFEGVAEELVRIGPLISRADQDYRTQPVLTLCRTLDDWAEYEQCVLQQVTLMGADATTLDRTRQDFESVSAVAGELGLAPVEAASLLFGASFGLTSYSLGLLLLTTLGVMVYRRVVIYRYHRINSARVMLVLFPATVFLQLLLLRLFTALAIPGAEVYRGLTSGAAFVPVLLAFTGTLSAIVFAACAFQNFSSLKYSTVNRLGIQLVVLVVVMLTLPLMGWESGGNSRLVLAGLAITMLTGSYVWTRYLANARHEELETAGSLPAILLIGLLCWGPFLLTGESSPLRSGLPFLAEMPARWLWVLVQLLAAFLLTSLLGVGWNRLRSLPAR